MNNNSTVQFLRERIVTKKGLLILGIILFLMLPVLVYLLDIDWVMQIRVYGFPGIFLLSFFASMTILLPIPGEAVLAAAPGIMELSGIEVFWFGVVASIGGSLGELTGYFAGYWGRVVIKEKHEKGYGRVERWMRRYGGVAIFFFALTPLPFDLVGIVSGSLSFPLWKFLIFCWAGRLVRALLIVYLGWGSFQLFFLEEN